MRVLMVALLVATVLSGCSDPETLDLDSQNADPGPQPPARDPDPAPEQDAGQEEDPGPNTAPTATLTANATTGDAPVTVTFTLDADDADGDNLTWTFDKDDDGTVDEQGEALPATVEATYPVGNFTARLVVYDGRDEANATLLVESFEPAGPEAPTGPVQELTLAWPVGGTVVPALVDGDSELCGRGRPHDGTLYRSFEVDPASRGAPVTATVSHNMVVGGVAGWGIVFLDDDCGQSESLSDDATAPLAGTVPAFATWAIAYSNGGEGVTVAYSAG